MDKFIRWSKARAAVLFWLTAIGLPAQTFTTLASFGGTVVLEPNTLLQGLDGNFYGTTNDGGAGSCTSFGLADACGTVFEVTPGGVVTTLYSFGLTANDGIHPTALIQATDGNFYGTTFQGGAANLGTIFSITPGGEQTTFYSFEASDLTGAPNFLIQATDGNFYGTSSNNGSVFKFTPAGALTVLHAFQGPEGSVPIGGLIQAADGDLYGTTEYGGSGNCQSSVPDNNGCGTIFKITTEGLLTKLYSFQVTDGANPANGLVQAADGNFYGTTQFGGTGNCDNLKLNLPSNGCGTIFKMTPEGTLTTLYSFDAPVTGGALTRGVPLIQAADGNFYGTTSYGGIDRCGSAFGLGCGTIFKITPAGALSTVYSLGVGATDGLFPEAVLIQATDGNLYGTTVQGGANNVGTVFQFTLPSPDAPAIASTGGVVSGASFQAGIVPSCWITINGTNLSSKTDNWDNAIVNGNYPTELDGVRVMVGEQPAYIAYVSPTQINALAPNVPVGTLSVTVTTSIGSSLPISAMVQTAQPAFFQWGNYAVATTQDFGLAVKNGTVSGVTTAPAKPGEVIILWGTGFGPTSPPAPPGIELPSNTIYNTANTVTVTVGGKSATVYGAALAPGFAGLYQVAIQIPVSLATGDYAVVASVSGAQSPSTTLITVQD